MDQLLLYSSADGWDVDQFYWDCLLSRIRTCYCINSCYWKLLKKYCQTVTYTLFYCLIVYTVILSILLLLHHWYCYCHHIVPVIKLTWISIDLNKNVIKTTYTGIGKINGGDSVCILGGPRIQVAQPRYGSLQGSRGWLTSRIVHIVIVIDTLLLLLTA